MRIPKDFPVRVLGDNEHTKSRVTCMTCGRAWDDSIITSMTPTPSGRCPFEYYHKKEREPKRRYWGVVRWQVEDIQGYRPNWTEKECLAFLREHESALIDAGVRAAGEYIEDLLPEEE